MPPAPPANMPLPERLMAMAKTLQFAWFVGHLTLIICTLRYSFSWMKMNYYGGMAQFSYRTSFVAAALTYGIVVYKTWRSRSKVGVKAPGGALGLLGDENVQYLAMALVWLFTPQNLFAMLPYCIYSIFHVATYTRANLIPTLQPPKPVEGAGATSPSGKTQYAPNPMQEKIGAFVKEYYDASMSVVAGLEILLWVRILVAAVLWRPRSWIILGIYTAFLRARFSQSSHVQGSFAQLEARVDGLVGSQGTPPAARQAWDTVKMGARQFNSATDMNKYVNGAAAPKKTS